MRGENLRETLMGGQSFSWRDEGDCFSAVLNGKVYRIRDIEDARHDPFLYGYFDLGYDYELARQEIAARDGILRRAVESTGMIRLLRDSGPLQRCGKNFTGNSIASKRC